MKLFDFNIDHSIVTQNQSELADTIRILLYKENPALFNQLTYEDDRTFLEPTLFYFFLAKSKNLTKPTIQQCTFGYIEPGKRPSTFEAISDDYGLINLPNVGYILTEPSKLHTLRWDIEKKNITAEGYPSQFIADDYLMETPIRLCKHHTFLISQLSLDGKIVRFNESADTTVKKHLHHIEKAFSHIKDISPEFNRLLVETARELVIMSSPNIYSMAAISYHGSAFVNTEGNPHDEIFFVDDIVHQCGHIIYNALTLETTKYLKVHKETFLRDFITEKREGRTVYSAFHGLFTYSTILYFLDQCLSQFEFSPKQKHETLGRIGFYTKKFGSDLVSLANDQIFTTEGMAFVESFRKGHEFIKEKYSDVLKEMTFEGSPYVFGYDFFSSLNPLQKFREYVN